MLLEDAGTCESLRRIVIGLTADTTLHEDLMQEGLIRLWVLPSEKPGRTNSWYLQNCRFHLQHWLQRGRSVDSYKRSGANNRVTVETGDEFPLGCYDTNGELFESVSARDIVTTLTSHLPPLEAGVLTGLDAGLRLRDVASELNLSYPTALKYRRKIAGLTVRLGIASAPVNAQMQTQLRHPNGCERAGKSVGMPPQGTFKHYPAKRQEGS